MIRLVYDFRRANRQPCSIQRTTPASRWGDRGRTGALVPQSRRLAPLHAACRGGLLRPADGAADALLAEPLHDPIEGRVQPATGAALGIGEERELRLRACRD